MIKDGRQWATSLSEIRRDHVERYRWASRICKGLVADLGCGIGYGSKMLAEAGCFVNAYDASAEAIAFGEEHWAHVNVRRKVLDLGALQYHLVADWAVCFELIEHVAKPSEMLEWLNIPKMLCSVPNQDVMPFDPKRHSYHHRHYTKQEFASLLTSCGWTVEDWWMQAGKQSPVALGDNGMTLIAECKR